MDCSKSKKRNKHIDVEKVRNAASGRWSEYFSSWGIPAEHLNGSTTEHPCPKCHDSHEGSTRFRLIDAEAGALYCSHCFSEKNGDGFAATAWWFGLHTKNDWPEIVQKVADFFGVKADAKKRKKSWKEKIEVLEWNDAIGSLWIQGKPPATLVAIREAGAVRAKHYDDIVIAFPIHGEKAIIGYAMYSAMPRGTITHKVFIDGKLKKVDRLKTKTIKEEGKSGFVGSIERIKNAKYLLKVEGPPDMLAANSLLPEEWAAISNYGGGGEGPKPWIVKQFEGKELSVVIGDCDAPGQKGAAKWSQAIAKVSQNIKNVVLPYAITTDHGKDVRDFLNERSVDELLALIEGTAPFEPDKDDNGNVKDVEPDKQAKYQRCLEDLGIEVLGENEQGQVMVHSSRAAKTRLIQIENIKHETLLKLAGPAADQYVATEPDESYQYHLSTVKRAIASAAWSRPLNRVLGPGIWPGNDGSVILAGKGLHVYRPNEGLVAVAGCAVDNRIFEIGNLDWVDADALAVELENASDRRHCIQSVQQLMEIVDRFCWTARADPTVIAGLIMASWLQAFWEARPLVSIRGDTDSGKSTFYKFLEALFGSLADISSASSEAGIRQSLGRTGKIPFIDEFDQLNKSQRQQLLNYLRHCRTGSQHHKGTVHQTVKTYHTRRIAWIAGQVDGIEKAADANRFVKFELTLPTTQESMAFREVDPEEAGQFGVTLLAIAIRHAHEAVRLSKVLGAIQINGVTRRIVQNYAVPLAVIVAANGIGQAEAEKDLREILAGGPEEERCIESNAVQLIRKILDAEVVIDDGHRTTLLVSECVGDSDPKIQRHLARYGLARRTNDEEGQDSLLFSHNLIVGRLLKGDRDHNPTTVRQTLLRVPGATYKKRSLTGNSRWCVIVPWATLLQMELVDNQNEGW